MPWTDYMTVVVGTFLFSFGVGAFYFVTYLVIRVKGTDFTPTGGKENKLD